MILNFKFLLVLILILSYSNVMAAGDLVTVNGKVIKQSVYDYIAKDATSRGQKIDEEVKQAISNKLIDAELVSQEARRLGLDKQAGYIFLETQNIQALQKESGYSQEDINARVELSRYQSLSSTYLQDYMSRNPITDNDLKAVYEDYKKAYGDKEYNVLHIVVKTESEAKDVIAQLKNGGDFAQIAKDKSIDSGSKNNGGNLGWFTPAAMVKSFSDATAALQKNAITSIPIQTRFGWHVIKLIDIRSGQPFPYDKVKDGLQKTLQQRNLDRLVADLRNKAAIVNSGTLSNGIGSQQPATSNTVTPISPAVDIASAKKKCEELGFKPKTEKFGKCVLELTK